MANSKFWRHMAARFSALQDPHLLTAEWSLDSFSVDAGKEIWKIRCDRTANVLKLSFEELARQSAIEACADIGAGDSLDSWLALLKLETGTFESKPTVYLWKQHPPDLRPYMANLAMSGVIHKPSRVSAAYCLRLETSAVRAERSTRTASRASSGNSEVKFPNRAAWLAKRLHERSWDKNDLKRHSGPDRKTVQKILDGRTVRAGVFEGLAEALSRAPKHLNLPPVKLEDIPAD